MTPIWSEYKITFPENKLMLLGYLFEKGYFPYDFHNKYFKYSQFLNYKSSDLETSHIGLYDIHDNQLMYMPEDKFDKLNETLSDVSFDMLEYAFSIDKPVVILKRGIYLNKKGEILEIFGTGWQIKFSKINSNKIMCRLDLVKILDDERNGWIVPSFIPSFI